MSASPAAAGATTALTRLSAAEIAGLATRGEVSVQEVVDAHIARIEAVNPALNAVVVPLFEQARQAARQMDARRSGGTPGPLYGVPVTVKESFDVAGTAATAGIPSLAARRAAADAPLVARLRAAGAVVLGKTNVAQALLYVESDNPLFGRTNNPWDQARSAGGSSGGEAAIVAAGGSALGLGTDIGGSVRVPAHDCGLCSLKPTPGRLTLQGTVDALLWAGSEGIPNTAGPIARHVADLRLALQALQPGQPPAAGGDPLVVPVPFPDPDAIAIRGLRVGVYEDDGFFPASDACRRAVREAAAALEARGAVVLPFQVPDIGEVGRLAWGLLAPDSLDGLRRLLGKDRPDPRLADILTLVGTPNGLRPLLAALFRARGQRRLSGLLPSAGRQTARQYLDLIAARRAFQLRVLAAVDQAGLDALLCPPASTPAVTHGATRALGPASVLYTFLYNLLGWPAGVVPVTRVRQDEQTSRPPSRDLLDDTARQVDLASAGLPVGVQLAARPWREDLVLALMAALESDLSSRPDYPTTPV